MAANKIEKASISFGIGRQGGGVVIDVRLNHDTISALRGVQIGFELLNGITLEQGKKILDVLNENVVGLVVTTAETKTDDKTGDKTGDKTQAASG
ncbi:MAG: hypothetical protein WBD25_09490 [Terriglobales bacterium]